MENYGVSENLASEIAEKAYELPSGIVRFSKGLRDKFRKETGDYHSDKIEIITKMLEIYNNAIERA